MGNNNLSKQNKNLSENKKEFKFVLTRNNISDITIYYNYEKKYESISSKNSPHKNQNNNYIFIICGLIDGFIEIYKNIFNGEFKLSLSFKAHNDVVSKIIQLKNNGYLLTSSFDNSFKIFKLSKNCTRETLIYKIYLNPIFNRINDIILHNKESLIISVFNHIIYFPYNKNNLSENKNNLSDYVYSKYQHQYKYLSNLVSINDKIFLTFYEIENKILFFKLISPENINQDIEYIKSVLICSKEENNNDSDSKICIENLFPKYNFILLSINNYIKIIDIKYLEIIIIYEMKIPSFFLYHNNPIDRILLFGGNNILTYKTKKGKDGINFVEENHKCFEINIINGLNKIRKSVSNPLNNKIIYFFYKKILMKLELNYY